MIWYDLILAAVTSADKKRVELLKRLPEAEDAKTLTVMAKKDDLKVKTKEQRLKGKINEELEHENEVHGQDTMTDYWLNDWLTERLTQQLIA